MNEREMSIWKSILKDDIYFYLTNTIFFFSSKSLLTYAMPKKLGNMKEIIKIYLNM